MNSTPLRRAAGTVCVVLLPMLAAIASCTTEPPEPPRPGSVPNTAFWVGGADGGVFVQLERRLSDPRGVYQAKVYYEAGEVWYEGPLVLDPLDGADVNIADRRIFSGWDGTQLILVDGRVMRKQRT